MKIHTLQHNFVHLISPPHSLSEQSITSDSTRKRAHIVSSDSSEDEQPPAKQQMYSLDTITSKNSGPSTSVMTQKVRFERS